MRLSMPLQAYLDYLISEPELFARGYAQWVESWERDALITDQLNYWLAPVRQRVPEQWARNEFVDGIAVFNALFLELGWMKT